MIMRAFLCILSLSVSGALTGLVLFLVRPVTKKIFSKKWNYYIWLVVVARLVIPVHLGLTDGMFEGLALPWSGGRAQEAAGETEMDLSDIDEAGGEAGTASLSALRDSEKDSETFRSQSLQKAAEEPDALTSSDSISPVTPVDGTETGTNRSFPGAESVLSALWLAGALLFFLTRTVGYCRFNRRIRKNSREVRDERLLWQMQDMCRRLSLKKAPALWESASVSGPITIGLLRPVIVLPAENPAEAFAERGSAGQYTLTLHHELIHIKRRDLWYKWLYQLLLCIHWFNPVLHLVGRKLNQDCELSCDEAVLEILTQDGKRAYGNLLISAAERSLSGRNNVFSTTLLERKEDLKERLKGILQYRKQGRCRRAASLCAALGMAVLSACGSVQAAPDAMPIQVSGKTAGEDTKAGDAAFFGDEGEDGEEDREEDREGRTWVSFWSSLLDGIFDYDVDDFLKGRMVVNKNGKAWQVYDDDELLAGKDVNGQQSAFVYTGGSSGVSCSGLLLNGSNSILIRNVEEETKMQVDSSFELMEGRFKVVHVSPQGQVEVLNETGEKTSVTVTLQKGRNAIKMVGQGGKLRDLEIRFRQPGKGDAENTWYSETEEDAARVQGKLEKGEVNKEELFDALAYMEEEDVSQAFKLLLDQEIPLDTDEICDLLIYSDEKTSGRYLVDAVKSGRYRLSDRNALTEFFPYLDEEERGELLAATIDGSDAFTFQMLKESLPYLGYEEKERCVFRYLDQGYTLTYSQFAEITPYLSDETIEKMDERAE